MFGKKKEKTFCGKTWEEMDQMLNLVCDIDDTTVLAKEEQEALEIAIQCMSDVMNLMKVKGYKITFDRK